MITLQHTLATLFALNGNEDKLDDEILDKLIQGQKNDAMKNILCDVISELPSDKKNLIFIQNNYCI